MNVFSSLVRILSKIATIIYEIVCYARCFLSYKVLTQIGFQVVSWRSIL